MPDSERDTTFRIAAFSGYNNDRFDALQRQAETSGAHVLFGDYLAEMNLSWRALEIQRDPTRGYEEMFLKHLVPAAKAIAANKCKVVTNAGALNARGCAEQVVKILQKQGLNLKVAYVEGDNIISRLGEFEAGGEIIKHLEGDGRELRDWKHKPISANAYVGARGVQAALEAGADIVISGRCTDASPVIGAAVWWHRWSWDNYNALAGALLAGHCIECGAYVSGGNSSGFKAYKDTYFNFSMGIAEIARDGTFVITKQPKKNGFNGVVNTVTVRSQILYEIQGNIYLNPDVQGILDDVTVTEEAPDRVRVTGVRGEAPPVTTKAAICGIAGWQAETYVFGTGLDIKEKFETLRLQVYNYLGDRVNDFTVLDLTQYGVAQEDPEDEALGTAMLRVFAQAPKREAFGGSGLVELMNPEGLGHFPGFHWVMDFRSCAPKPYVEYWPGTISQKLLPLTVRFVGSKDEFHVPPVANTKAVIAQKDYDSAEPLVAGAYGPTTRAPIGRIVHARSGDKGGNANVGFFVRNADEYPWLKSLLSKKELQRMLAKEYKDNRLERVEFPGMLAVHFVIHDYLDKGVSSTARLDSLAKSVAEYLRAKYVDLPDKFLARGEI